MDFVEKHRDFSPAELFSKKQQEVNELKEHYISDFDKKTQNEILCEMEILHKELDEIKGTMQKEYNDNDTKMMIELEKLEKEYQEYLKCSLISGYPAQKLIDEYNAEKRKIWDKRHKDDELTHQKFENKINESINAFKGDMKNIIATAKSKEKTKVVAKTNAIKAKSKVNQIKMKPKSPSLSLGR